MGDTWPSLALEGVLRRVPPRSLAACRCVCRKWCAIIDSRRLLRPDLLPLSLGGIFLSLGPAQAPPALFARPSSSCLQTIAGGRDLDRYFLEIDSAIQSVLDCRDGLLLISDHVINPATRQWARLPPPCSSAWADGYGAIGEAYLVYDSAAAPDNYEVILIQDASFFEDKLEDGSEWPPSSYTMSIYSSRSRGWEERSFVRDGEPAGTFGQARSAEEPTRHAVYWHGALYVHCTGYFIIRITFSDYKYQVIKLPAGVDSSTAYYKHLPGGVDRMTVYNQHLAKSRDGVYFALVRGGFQLQVWFLNEVNGESEWLFKYDIDLRAVKPHFRADLDHPVDRPWILQHTYYSKGNNTGEVAEDWDSDDDNVVEIDQCGCRGCEEGHGGGPASIFGFHPFKEVALLHISGRVVAFHLESSKIQYLGELSHGYYGDVVEATFVYTPCWIGQLSDHNKCI